MESCFRSTSKDRLEKAQTCPETRLAEAEGPRCRNRSRLLCRTTSASRKPRRRVATEIEQLRSEYVNKFAYSEIAWVGDTANIRVVALARR